MSSSYRSVDWIELWSAFSTLFSKCLHIFSLCGDVFIFKILFVKFFSLPFSELSLVGLALDMVD